MGSLFLPIRKSGRASLFRSVTTRLLASRDDEAAIARIDWGEGAIAVSFEEEADASVHVAGFDLGSVEILDDVEVGDPVAIEFLSDDAKDRRDLRKVRQWLERELAAVVNEDTTVERVGFHTKRISERFLFVDVL